MEKKSIAALLAALPQDTWSSAHVCFRRIQEDEDLWYAVAECKITPEQEEFVNPAGFSLGRAYLAPEDNVPCVISGLQIPKCPSNSPQRNPTPRPNGCISPLDSQNRTSAMGTTWSLSFPERNIR